MATAGNRRGGSDNGYRDFSPSNYRGRHGSGSGSGSGLCTTTRASEFSSKDQERDVTRPHFDNKRKFSPVGPDGREKRRIESRPREEELEEGELEEAGRDMIEQPASVVRDGIDRIRGCRSGNEYEYLHEISEGTYGKVSKGRDKKTGEEVALKKVKMDGRPGNLGEYGFPITALREINILVSLQHPSIVVVKEMGVGKALDSFYMVMEHLDHDLRGLMQAMRQPFSTCEVKCLMLQLLQGVKYIHDSFVLHRDLKTSNLLYKDGRLKICDFGMSRRYRQPVRPYTSGLVTLWYRPPELLLGAKTYSTAVDMWSVGCIMAELLAKEPLFPGKYEIHQLGLIFQTLGTPNETKWPGFSKLPGAKGKFVQQSFNLLRKKFPKASFTGHRALSDKGFDLLNKLLTLDPRKRITADAALCHPWFQEFPLPKTIDMMPSFPPRYGKNR